MPTTCKEHAAKKTFGFCCLAVDSSYSRLPGQRLRQYNVSIMLSPTSQSRGGGRPSMRAFDRFQAAAVAEDFLTKIRFLGRKPIHPCDTQVSFFFFLIWCKLCSRRLNTASNAFYRSIFFGREHCWQNCQQDAQSICTLHEGSPDYTQERWDDDCHGRWEGDKERTPERKSEPRGRRKRNKQTLWGPTRCACLFPSSTSRRFQQRLHSRFLNCSDLPFYIDVIKASTFVTLPFCLIPKGKSQLRFALVVPSTCWSNV